jgi:hypothetical protein
MLQLQRVRAFTRGGKETAQLVQAGFGSAAEVVHEGVAALALRLPTLPMGRVEAVYAGAQGVVTTAMLLAVNYDLSARTSHVPVLPGAEDIGDSVARD